MTKSATMKKSYHSYIFALGSVQKLVLTNCNCCFLFQHTLYEFLQRRHTCQEGAICGKAQISDSNPNILLVQWAGRLEPPGSKHQEHLGESFFTAFYVDSVSKKKLFLLFLIPHAGGETVYSELGAGRKQLHLQRVKHCSQNLPACVLKSISSKDLNFEFFQLLKKYCFKVNY